MAKYLVLIYGDEKLPFSEQEWQDLMAAHMRFSELNKDALVGGEALENTSTATSIRSNGNDDFVVTDAPFAETKEALGGYYLIEAADLDTAVAIAKQVPAPGGGVEVRPVMSFD